MKEIKYVDDNGFCETPCPPRLKEDGFSKGDPELYHGRMVGSASCTGHKFYNTKPCPYFLGEIGDNTVLCSHPEA